MKTKRRWWAFLLAACLCFTLVATAFADERQFEGTAAQMSDIDLIEDDASAQFPVEIQSAPSSLSSLSNYPKGSYFSQTGVACTCHSGNCHYDGSCDCRPYGNALQCMAFAKYAFDQFSHRSTWTDISADRDNTIRDISTEAKAKMYFSTLPIGSYVRVARPDGDQTNGDHSFVIIGRTNSGITIYEANNPSNCRVWIRELDYSSIPAKYSKITASISHDYSGAIAKYNSTYHKVYCSGSGCTGYMLIRHYALNPGANAVCLGCGYKGWINQGVQNIISPDFVENDFID